MTAVVEISGTEERTSGAEETAGAWKWMDRSLTSLIPG
jgi:hypothetical protein